MFRTILLSLGMTSQVFLSADLGANVDEALPPCPTEPKPARRQLPPPTEYWGAKLVEREDGLMLWRSESGKEFINVGVFGEQLQGVQKDVALNKRQSASLAYLIGNAERLAGAPDALTWRSNYSTNYDTLMISPPWSGGYAQSSIISGFLTLHEAQPTAGWLAMAVQAGLAYGVPTAQGGYLERLPNGCVWFEELTSVDIAKSGQSPHICNGHIYATLHLTRLARASGDDRIRRLAAEGERSLKAMMKQFDNGTWVRYDLSPRVWDLRFCLNLSLDEAFGGADAVVGPLIQRIELRRCGIGGSPVLLCLGEQDDDVGAWRIGDGSYGSDFGVVPWGPRVAASAEDSHLRGRRVRSGKSVFVLELPQGAETDYFREPYLQMRVFYRDIGSPGSLDVMVFSMREQVNNEYAELPGVAHRLSGDGALRVLEKSVRLCDLGKSSLTAWKVTNAYVRPLAALEQLTGDAFYRDWRIRLEGQVRCLSETYPHLEFGKR